MIPPPCSTQNWQHFCIQSSYPHHWWTVLCKIYHGIFSLVLDFCLSHPLHLFANYLIDKSLSMLIFCFLSASFQFLLNILLPTCLLSYFSKVPIKSTGLNQTKQNQTKTKGMTLNITKFGTPGQGFLWKPIINVVSK